MYSCMKYRVSNRLEDLKARRVKKRFLLTEIMRRLAQTNHVICLAVRILKKLNNLIFSITYL